MARLGHAALRARASLRGRRRPDHPSGYFSGTPFPPRRAGYGEPVTVATHEHTPQLVEVVFDDTGSSVREFVCTSCQSAWFE